MAQQCNESHIGLDDSIRSYTALCRSSDNQTLREIVNGIRYNHNSNVIARNSCVSINTINKTKTLYNRVGERTMLEIADKLCLHGGKQTVKPPALKLHKVNPHTVQGRKQKSIDEHLDTFNKGIDSANKTIEAANKAADLTVATATALAGLFNKIKSSGKSEAEIQKKNPKTVDDMRVDLSEQHLDEDDVSVNPTTKEEVLKNIMFLQEQMMIKDQQIVQKDAVIAKKTQESADLNYKLQTMTAKALALEAKIKQDAMSHAKEIETFRQTHMLQVEKAVADTVADKDLECGTKLLNQKSE